LLDEGREGRRGGRRRRSRRRRRRRRRRRKRRRKGRAVVEVGPDALRPRAGHSYGGSGRTRQQAGMRP